jgi:uncharacterized protein YndB with AHSA1/START domain
MQITLNLETDVSAAPEKVFSLACDDVNLPRFFHKLGPIPGVTGCTALPSEPGEVARRKVLLTDGTSMVEIILEREQPSSQRYKWGHPPAPPLHVLIRGAEAQWRLQSSADGSTHITVRYRFDLTSRLALPAGLVLRALFARWLAAALRRIKRQAEAQVA